MASIKKMQRLVLTGAVTAITIAGTLYGANMKMQHEVTEVNQKSREATIDEKIESLRSTRQNLSMKKDMVQKQIQDLEVRMEDKKRKGLVEQASERPREG